MSKQLHLYIASIGSKWRRDASAVVPHGLPALPYTVDEALEDVAACHALGARFFHVHSRGENGEHVADPAWYQAFAREFRRRFPDARICFATSRSGEVIDQIRAKESVLREQLDEADARLDAEGVRLACVASDDPVELPDLLTAFTATEVRIYAEDAEIGHVAEARSARITRDFYHRLVAVATAKRVLQEIEITTPQSIDVIERLQHESFLRAPVSIVLLPGFTRSFPFVPEQLAEIVRRAHRVIERNEGGGMLTLGCVLPPATPGADGERERFVRFAVEHPHIDAIRIGLEDAPYLDGKPASNREIVLRTLALIERSGGTIRIGTEALPYTSAASTAAA
ncbi:3-keto-5-aminohexanoate cleavage protein [Burkholderia contaminans]|nr:3-keto-5-aminohexanoate cleavage protein [Burkholderia contaminans]